MSTQSNAAVAAIQYALEDDDGIEFLRYWNEGEFDVLRRNWENIPEEVFIGSDQLHPKTVIAADVDVPEGWRVDHAEPWGALTDAANGKMRYAASRLSAPFSDSAGKRIWFGATLSEAIGAGLEALASAKVE